jgi:hypothetical protein
MVPIRLEYPDDGDQEGAEEAPAPSMGISSTRSKHKSNLKRGQHERHQTIEKKVHAIHRIGAKGQPLEPRRIIGTFSNQCSCIVRDKVPITYDGWRKVPKEIKGTMWGEAKRQFTYPAEGYDEEKCKSHVLFIIGKVLRNFRSMLNREYVQIGRTPFKDYNKIRLAVWEEFVKKMSTKEAKAKDEKFKELAKRNELAHHLGMIGYAAKMEQWLARRKGGS